MCAPIGRGLRRGSRYALATLSIGRANEVQDSRIKLMAEILSGIKVLKLYAWEPQLLEAGGGHPAG